MATEAIAKELIKPITLPPLTGRTSISARQIISVQVTMTAVEMNIFADFLDEVRREVLPVDMSAVQADILNDFISTIRENL